MKNKIKTLLKVQGLLGQKNHNAILNEIMKVINEDDKKVRETAMDILKMVESYEKPKGDQVIAYHLGASGMKFDIEELIAKKYKLRAKYKKSVAKENSK